MGKLSGLVNQYLASFVIDEEFSAWGKNNFLDYKSMYLISKTWRLFQFWQFYLPQ